jgi:hypothetical protein
MSRTCIEFLKCFFTPAERAELSDEMARQMAGQFEAEEEFKQVKQQFKDRILGHAQAAKKLARRLNFLRQENHRTHRYRRRGFDSRRGGI